MSMSCTMFRSAMAVKAWAAVMDFSGFNQLYEANIKAVQQGT